MEELVINKGSNGSFANGLEVYSRRLLYLLPLWVFIFVTQAYLNLSAYQYVKNFPGFAEPLYRLLFFPIFHASLATMLLALIPYRFLRRCGGVFISVLYFCLFIVELYLLQSSTMLYSETAVVALMQTNPNESKEFLSSIEWSLLTPYMVGLSVFLLILMGGGKIFINRLLTPFRDRANSKAVSCCRYLLILGLISPILLGGFVIYPRQIHLILEHKEDGLKASALSSLDRFFFYNYVFLSHEKNLKQDYARLKEAMEQISVYQGEGLATEEHVVVLIMGESLNRRYMHCYGYPLPNTPHLDSLISRGEIVLFDDVVSPATQTVGAVSEVLSFHKYEDKEGWLSTPALLPILKKVGYESYWLSRHERRGMAVSRISVLAEDADSAHYVTNGYDDALLPYLNKDRSGKRFDLIHLMGSHVNFKLRFPTEYTRFQPSDIPRRGATFLEDRYTILADYANSIFFNDWVVSRIIEHYKERKAIVIYLSDHGQALYDDPTLPETLAHALSPVAVEVPMMVYLSPSMREEHPDLADKLEMAKHHPIMTDLFSISLAGLLQIDLPQYDARFDFLSDKYDASRRRYVLGKGAGQMMDYDKRLSELSSLR